VISPTQSLKRPAAMPNPDAQGVRAEPHEDSCTNAPSLY
jgi:hypothetical protein